MLGYSLRRGGWRGFIRHGLHTCPDGTLHRESRERVYAGIGDFHVGTGIAAGDTHSAGDRQTGHCRGIVLRRDLISAGVLGV
jgi:hypothetical protein